MATEVTVTSGDDLARITARAKDSVAIGTIIARILESVAQRSFREQRLGEHVWPERYPSMEDPFVNLAALVEWTNAGGGMLSRFFDRRPALMGTGALAGSISGRVTNGFVEVGSALPYASVHQHGGTSVQQVTETAKKTIGGFIGEERGPDGKWRRKKRLGSNQKSNREKFWFKLAPLLGMDVMETRIEPRPFLGITDEAERDIVESVEAFVAGGG